MGQKHSSLTIIEILALSRKGGNPPIMCKCDCGKVIKTYIYRLNKTAKSCGCEHPQSFHGKSRTPEYRAWISIKERCLNPNFRCYYNYGGRGISICERWLDAESGFNNFFSDLGVRPSKNHSLDRINFNGNYEPSNCRWATAIEQANNKRTNVMLTYKGETKSLSSWCKQTGIDYIRTIKRFQYRKNKINTDIDFEKLLYDPVKRTYKGKK